MSDLPTFPQLQVPLPRRGEDGPEFRLGVMEAVVVVGELADAGELAAEGKIADAGEPLTALLPLLLLLPPLLRPLPRLAGAGAGAGAVVDAGVVQELLCVGETRVVAVVLPLLGEVAATGKALAALPPLLPPPPLRLPRLCDPLRPPPSRRVVAAAAAGGVRFEVRVAVSLVRGPAVVAVVGAGTACGGGGGGPKGFLPCGRHNTPSSACNKSNNDAYK